MPANLIAGLVTLLALPSIPLSQNPPVPSPSPSQPSNVQTVRVRGCLNGRSIKPAADSDLLLMPSRDSVFRLKGSRAMMATLKEHDGHEDEIIGTMKIATESKAKVVKEKEVGKGRVYVGAGSERNSTAIKGTDDVTVDVTSLTHLKPACQN
jgi:hypothetical protein